MLPDLRACLGLVLLLAAALLPGMAWAQAEPTTDAPAYLGSFPTPEKVRADVVASAGDAAPEVIEGRVMGRLKTLASALRHSWRSGYRNSETGLPIPGIERAPPAAKQLHAMYSDEIDAITRNVNKAYPRCGFIARLLQLTGIAHACERLGYQIARDKSNGTYANNAQASAQIAALYFPPELQALFIETSGGDGRYMSRHQVLAAGQNREAESAAERSSARWTGAQQRMEARWFPAGVMVLIGIGWFLIYVDARPRKAPDPQKVNRVSDIADLHLFDIRGHLVGTHERTSLHVTTTTQTSGGGGYVHPTYGGHVSAPSTTTQTTTTTKHHQTMFIRKEDGEERQVEFTDLDFPVRADSSVAIVYAGDRVSERGYPVAAVNLDTGRWAMDGRRIGWITTGKPAAKLWFQAMLVPLGIVLWALAAGSWVLAVLGLGAGVVVVGLWRWQGNAHLVELKRAVASSIRARAQALAEGPR